MFINCDYFIIFQELSKFDKTERLSWVASFLSNRSSWVPLKRTFIMIKVLLKHIFLALLQFITKIHFFNYISKVPIGLRRH